jgi:hypothetical protein
MPEPFKWAYHSFGATEEWCLGLLGDKTFECRIRPAADPRGSFESTHALSAESAIQFFRPRPASR